MYRLVFQKSVTVTGVNHGRHISCVSPDRVWISDWYNLILTNSTGHRLEQLKDVGCGWGVHTVNSDGDLIYIDSEHNINKLSTDNKDKTTLIKYNTAPWIPLCVYSSPTTGDLMVGMCDTDPWTGKVVRYNSSGENIHTIQHDKITAMGLYSLPIYITENRNGDVIVSDYYYGVVVTDRRGNYRFSYTGPPSGSGLWSHGICTDALSHILVCDDQTQSIHIINCNGEFLSQILSPQHGIDRPFGLCYYEKTHKLWVGSLNNNTANIYKVVHRDSLTGTHKMDEEGAISSPGESWIASLSKFGSDRPVIYGDSNRMDSGLGLSGIGIEESHEDLPDYSEESGGKRLKREKRELAEEKEFAEKTSFQTKLSSFENKTVQFKRNGDAQIRIIKLVDSINIEQTYPQQYHRNQTKTTEYEDALQRVDYLDCSGLDFSKSEKQMTDFSQIQVDDFLNWMKDCNEVFQKAQSAKCRSILSTLFAAHIKEEILEIQPKNVLLIIDHCMDYAIENKNHILILELVRLYIFSFDFNLQRRFENKNINSAVIATLLQTAKCMILRRCPRLRQNAISLSFCYVCSEERTLVMIMSYNGIIEMKDGIPEKAMGIDLVLYNYTQPSDEAYTVCNSFMASSFAINLPVIAENEARKLFKKHSNLTLISASPFKSIGYSKGKHRVVEKPCISLLCLHKGFIPIGEREFPKQINGFDVDVQEGYCSFGGGRSIDFGGHIRRARGINTPGNGSIGGFVDLPNGLFGLITCAHVVFSSDELIIPNSEMLNFVLGKGIDLNVEFFDKTQHNFQVCGTIVNKSFPSSSVNNSVDAALIKLDPTVNEFEFPVTDQLYSAGFDPNNPPLFTGEVVNVPDPDPVSKVSSRIPDKSDSVVKYGSKTRFTIGNLYFNGAHIRFVDDTGNLPDNTIAVMCNQIEIQSLPHGTFFEPGDSGAFVFCINPDKKLSCIGMAIGSTTKGTCFVTPMTRILDSFGLPHILKPGPSISSENTSRSSGNPSSSHLSQQSNASSELGLEAILLKLQMSITDVQNQQRNIQSSLHSVQIEVGNLKTEVGNLKTEVQAEFGNLRTEVQREVGNLRTEVQVENENLRTQVQTEVGVLKTQVQEIKEEYTTRSSVSSPDINQN